MFSGVYNLPCMIFDVISIANCIDPVFLYCVPAVFDILTSLVFDGFQAVILDILAYNISVILRSARFKNKD